MSAPARDTPSRSDQRRKKRRASTTRTPEPRQIVSGAGQPLDPGVRRELEQRLGHDFSRVRLHTDRDAAALTELLGADAVTVGENVFFADGAYRPDTADGRRLLAHELLHTVQAPHALGTLRAGRDLGAVSLPHEPMEREAEAGAHSVEAEVAPTPAVTPGWLRYATVDADRDRTERLDPATLVDRLTADIIRSLRGDPTDASGRVRLQLARFSPEVEQSVLDRLEQRLPTPDWERVVDFVDDVEENGSLGPGASQAPEPIEDFIEQWHRDREREEQAERDDRERDEAVGEDAEQREEQTEERDAVAEAPSAAPASASAVGPATAVPGQGPGVDEREEEEAPQEEGEAEEAEQQDEEPTEEEEREEEEQEEEQEEEEEEEEEEQEPEQEEPAEEREIDGAARTLTMARAVTETAPPSPLRAAGDEQPQSADAPTAEERPTPPPEPVTSEQQAPERPSAWDVELRPDDFLPSGDLDVSGVPTADQLEPGSSAQQSMPSFPEPPATKAEEVQAERDREDAAEAAGDEEPQSLPEPEPAAAEAPAAEPESRPEPQAPAPDLGTEQSVEQEVGPDPTTVSTATASEPEPTAPTPEPDPEPEPEEPTPVSEPEPEREPEPEPEPEPESEPEPEPD
ncbi:DUF4157 domain-containing protein, partial [Streptomyces sp. 8K308]|uniref:eCIS core domain-containing protein n=1 Tax=Streptomyces sp. 8K308 TaxID=2530388 RepID=UPI001A9FC52F